MSEKSDTLKEAIGILSDALFEFESPEWILSRIRTVRDVYVHRRVLKEIGATPATVHHIANLVCVAIQKNIRFRRKDCLKVLRNHIWLLSEGEELSSDTITILFEIYKHFIWSESEEVRWWVSNILKDKELSEDALAWCFENCDKSHFIANRLILYPNYRSDIAEWAMIQYKTRRYPDQHYRLLAQMITSEIPSFASNEDPNVLIWAVFYSHLKTAEKSDLILSLAEPATVTTIVKVASRLHAPDLIRASIAKLEDAS